MLKKTMIAGATAVLLGAGALAASSTAASATSYYGGGYVSGNGWFFGWGHRPGYKPYYPPKKKIYRPTRTVCTPKYKTVRRWNPYRGWVVYRVYAGKSCHPVPYRRYW